MLKPDGILFDLDGTLWDSSANIVLAWNAYLAAHPRLGAAPTLSQVDMHRVMGLEIEGLAAGLFPQLPPPLRMEITRRCCREEVRYLTVHGAPLCPGVAETLPALAAKAPLFIISNCQEGYIEAFLDFHRLRPLFSGFECSGRTGRPKEENIRRMAARHRLSRPIYVGDTATDRQAARSAGLPFFYARYGFGRLSPADCHGTLDSLAQLPPLLDFS